VSATSAPYAFAGLDAIERSGLGGNWIPVRRTLGVQAFGVNAWTAKEDGEVIRAHDESPSGHEELYLVLAGRATFTVAGEDVDAPAGTIVFVRDPGTTRGAVAAEAGTTILSLGGKPGEPFAPRSWEHDADTFPLFEQGEFAEAKRRLEVAVAEHPEATGLLYNLACAESRLGETDAALEHLAAAIERAESFRELAQTDPDLEAVRDDPRFPA
jgi:tetratricopeptide (TPR) repeat protein